MSQTLHTENAACTITVTATHLADATLRLHYRVVNRSAGPLYLCNLFWQESRIDPTTREEQFEISPHDAYVHLTNHRLHVALTAMRVALTDGIGIQFIPCLTRLDANQPAPFEATLDLPLPLVPYLKSADAAAAQNTPISLPLYFELGYFPGDTETEKHISPVMTTAGPAYQLAPFKASNQQVLAVGPFKEPVTVAPGLGKDATHPWD